MKDNQTLFIPKLGTCCRQALERLKSEIQHMKAPAAEHQITGEAALDQVIAVIDDEVGTRPEDGATITVAEMPRLNMTDVFNIGKQFESFGGSQAQQLELAIEEGHA